MERIQDSESKTVPGHRERKKAAIRDTVLNAAEKLFKTHGYVATSMTDIATKAGISRKTLFNYVETKESIVFALIDKFLLEHMPSWLESDKPHFYDARDILTPNIDERLDALIEKRWLLTLAAEHTTFFTSGVTPFASSALATNVSARAKRISAVQREGRIRREIPALDISYSYEALRDLVLRRWLLNPESTQKDLRKAFHDTMSILERGIAASSSTSTAGRSQKKR